MKNKTSSTAFKVPSSINIGGKDFSVKLSFHKKRSSSVRELQGALVFRLSSFLPLAKREEHFNYLLDKMQKKLLKAPMKKIVSVEELVKKGTFLFAKEQYFVELTSKKRAKLRTDNVIELFEGYESEIHEKLLAKIFIKKYEARMKAYLDTVNAQSYAFPVGKFHLACLRSKWGHCTSTNDIMLNLKLLNAPKEILDYVIYHELAHIKHKNHSPRFWKEVERFCPRHKEVRKYLKLFPPSLVCEFDEK